MIIALLGLSIEAVQAGEITTAPKPPDVSPRMKRLVLRPGEEFVWLAPSAKPLTLHEAYSQVIYCQ